MIASAHETSFNKRRQCSGLSQIVQSSSSSSSKQARKQRIDLLKATTAAVAVSVCECEGKRKINQQLIEKKSALHVAFNCNLRLHVVLGEREKKNLRPKQSHFNDNLKGIIKNSQRES